MAVWFITGCSTGIGRATAEAAAAAGHRVVATARRPDTLAALVDRFPDTVLALPLEVRDDAAVAAAVEAAIARFGRVDVLVNNAGIGYFSTIEESTSADAHEVMDANFWGAAAVTTALLPHLRAQRSGHIFTVSSIAGVRGSAGLGYYCASKFAVSGFMEALAAEVAHLGIRVTLLEPGPIRSQWIPSGAKNEDVLPDYAPVMEPFWERIHALPGRQPGSPAAVAEAMLRLADEAEPPLHLICGAHAVTQTRAKLARMGAEVDRWEGLSLGIDRED
ncbi:3-phenylpropionate-dihydrodiol/cinnamic acid-dihydrodiol dehydrogenase [Demequina sediminis]|uniref:3-phenylpropionate-dihydrodiol/cinnamic acid-dihydrodiol dehydrogenase n=1 Tax=Demequina sediminis TaxID=1930058 RepID=A0ABP9WH05_9MICO|nr:oxidoreductase [Demequina sediminis]BDZ60342.1 short-chain dehydrogenase/reductase [Demequina sediminis]